MKIINILIIAILFVAFACNTKPAKNNDDKEKTLDSYNGVAELMANTVLHKYPDIWSIEERSKPKWSYTYGLISMALMQVYETTNNEAYFNYAKAYADALIDENGIIKGYKKSDYNIDKLNSGKFLFELYKITNDERYKSVMDTLFIQLKGHPRTEVGGFWHKKRYTHQMWLDGLYMGGPYYAQYAKVNKMPEYFDEIALWFTNMEKVARDSETGLLYHGWDESREQKWANPESGCSPNFWGRGIGWYSMALVDVLDFFPKDHPQYNEILAIINRVAETMVKYQDKESGVWYQVVDQGNREGNYLEGSVSTMLSYFYLKAINKGYIDKTEYLETAKKAWQGTINTLVTVDEKNMLTISPVCAVAGLGGDPYRDGSYEYYINEAKRDNDPKAVGPFILAALQYDELFK